MPVMKSQLPKIPMVFAIVMAVIAIGNGAPTPIKALAVRDGPELDIMRAAVHAELFPTIIETHIILANVVHQDPGHIRTPDTFPAQYYFQFQLQRQRCSIYLNAIGYMYIRHFCILLTVWWRTSNLPRPTVGTDQTCVRGREAVATVRPDRKLGFRAECEAQCDGHNVL
ncbi:hypothetical protein MGG_17296 [Pyricularia oryzae 70-15]|uniref:Uncharacterized protein n=1 Tax=Pyricularia oryzae (strain 70-15 / ATCC MYA-4617 / FGSC 8958) TaxID=242507 RepID=G4NBK2_PYRO7|nr:uncharacterized protein MGG_17296 [Pyricularia oryzae 70-15]EHA48107.1 hypothetical protein MGG_17296 [Pyricularia oryzae 70-15]